ncbi:MAG: twin-arginine translocase TatA/TatE family subunit [Hyphomicrobium sp.]|nr:MAG: twin-arginine translocase TatA/TatE family subunit [Hyphomicrobium sp.]
MGAGSIWHWVILLLIVVLLFGKGKISEVMGDVAKGIKSFKKGMSDDDAAKAPEADKAIEQQTKAGEAVPAAERSKAG